MSEKNSFRMAAAIGLVSILTVVARAATAVPAAGDSPASARVAVVTFVSNHEQERAVRALIRSVRERSGALHSSPVFVVTTDAQELPCASLREEGVTVLPLEIDRCLPGLPPGPEGLCRGPGRKKVSSGVDTLIWLDPGVIVLKPLEALDLGNSFDAAVRPVTLANTIAIPPQTDAQRLLAADLPGNRAGLCQRCRR